MEIAIALVALLLVFAAYMAIAYQSMLNYAFKEHPTFVFKPGAQFSLTRPTNGSLATPPFRFVVIGDSTALGQGADSQKGNFSYQFAQHVLLNQYQSIQIYNLAVSGAKTSDMDKQIQTAISLEPNLLMLSVGANDVTGLVKSADFRLHYTQILQRLTSLSAKIAVLNIPSFAPSPLLWEPYRTLADWRAQQFNRIIMQLTKGEANVQLVDIYTGVKPDFTRYPDRNFSQDKFHPSTAGYSVWARVITEQLH